MSGNGDTNNNVPFNPMTFDPRLWEGLPSQTNGYDDTNAGRRKERLIPPGPPIAATQEVDGAPAVIDVARGWKEYHHPVKERAFFYNEELRIVTEMYIRHKHVLELVMGWYAVFAAQRDRLLPEAVGLDVFLDCSSGEACRYYMIDHANRKIRWLRHRTASDLGIPGVRNDALYLRRLLEEEYWLHAQYMPKDENHLGDSNLELQAVLASLIIDDAPSEGSMSPFTVEECMAYLLALGKATALGFMSYLNWLIAWIMGLMIRWRNANLHPGYGTSANRAAAVKESRHSFRSSFPYRRSSGTINGGTRGQPGAAKTAQIMGVSGRRPGFYKVTKSPSALFHRPKPPPSDEMPYARVTRKDSVEEALIGGASSKTGAPTIGDMEPRRAMADNVSDDIPPNPDDPAPVKPRVVIRGNMQMDEVVYQLTRCGCPDVTEDLHFDTIDTYYPICRGGSGMIFLARLGDGTQVAVKHLLGLGSIEMSDVGSVNLKHIAREIYAWSKCKHPMILRLIGIARFRGNLAVVSPWMKNGNLSSFIRKQPNINRVWLCYQSAVGLEYMHSRGIVHGDIKPANVVVSARNTPLFTDFGNAAFAYNSTLQFTKTGSFPFTPRYTAPELLKGDTTYTMEADIYAFAMMMLEVITGKVPFANTHEFAIIFLVADGKTPDRPSRLVQDGAIDDQLWKLFMECWAYKPECRPCAATIRQELARLYD